MKTLTLDTARALASRMVLAAPGKPSLKAEVIRHLHHDRIEFFGSKWPSGHSLALSNTTRERAVAHWEGYASVNGYTPEEIAASVAAPKVGDSVYFYTSNAHRTGKVATVGARRVHVTFRYRHGGAGKFWFPIDNVTRQPSVHFWSGRKA